jgi:hypothetical protein
VKQFGFPAPRRQNYPACLLGLRRIWRHLSAIVPRFSFPARACRPPPDEFRSVSVKGDDKGAPVLVDNFSPTRGFMKEFNRNEVKCCTVTRLIGVKKGAGF